MNRPRIAVTMGDPAGVGPEICLDLLRDEELAGICTPIVFGDAGVLERCARATGRELAARIVLPDELKTARAPGLRHFDTLSSGEVQAGVVSAETGRATYRYITEAIDACLRGEVAAVATGPANKEALRSAGIKYPGHTEIFAERTGAKAICMMLTSDPITCSFVTAHVGYHEVPALLTVERILETIELTRAALRRMRGREPVLVACGLNPHAGEHGLFGNREEEEIIAPALEQARAAGCQIEGPLPPDTAFLEWRRAKTDAFICMYHDQGHIPLKALAFDTAVNITLGLPIVRTSVDHGTALDIAWQGKASARSLHEAVKLAVKLCA